MDPTLRNVISKAIQSPTGLEAVHNMPGPYIILCRAQIMNHDAQGALSSINKGKNTHD